MTRAANAISTLTLLLLVAALVVGLVDDWGDEASADAVVFDAAGRRWAEQTTPATILSTGVRELERAESVRMRLDTPAEGEAPPIRFDITVIDTDNCFGTLRVDDGPAVEFAVAEGTDYLRTTAAGWASFVRLGDPSVSNADARSFGRLYAGTWVTSGAAAAFCGLLDELPLDDLQAFDRTGLTEVDGVQGVRLRLAAAGGGGSAVVDLQEPHRLVSFSGQGVTARFSDYDEDTEVPRPRASETVTLTSLG